jgi:hypothetical protein
MMRMRLPIAESKLTKHVDAFVIDKISFFHNITKQASYLTRVKTKLTFISLPCSFLRVEV